MRAPYVGRDALQSSQYRQMIGRAGRAGIDSSGESILVVNKKDEKKVSLDNLFSVCDMMCVRAYSLAMSVFVCYTLQVIGQAFLVG